MQVVPACCSTRGQNLGRGAGFVVGLGRCGIVEKSHFDVRYCSITRQFGNAWGVLGFQKLKRKLPPVALLYLRVAQIAPSPKSVAMSNEIIVRRSLVET
jgi:hypothetical protein